MLARRAVLLSMIPSHAAQLGLVCIQPAVMGRPLHLRCRLLSWRRAPLQISSCAASLCRCSCALGCWWRACSLRLLRCIDINPDGLLIFPAGLQNRVDKASLKM